MHLQVEYRNETFLSHFIFDVSAKEIFDPNKFGIVPHFTFPGEFYNVLVHWSNLLLLLVFSDPRKIGTRKPQLLFRLYFLDCTIDEIHLDLKPSHIAVSVLPPNHVGV